MSVHRNLWNQARPLFSELIELDSAERHTRLEEIGETAPQLRETLEALLHADSRDDDPLRSYNFAPSLKQRMENNRETRDPLRIIGKTISHFRVTDFIAAGGMGVVYRAEDLQLAREVALKFPAPHDELTDSVKQRFLREARAVALLDHPNLCSVYEVGESSNGVFLAMPFYNGETLKARLAREEKLSVSDSISIIRSVTTGLAFAHAAGIVHRDLKPGNIMLLPDGSVKILDFGLAKNEDLSQTRSGATLGTVKYMAPEQIRARPLDARADLWAVGVTLYEMLTGAPPFDGEHDLTLLHGILHSEALPPSRIDRDVPRRVDRLIAGLLQKDPSHRYESSAALLSDLDALEKGNDLAHRVPLWNRAWQRKPIRRAITAASVVLALGSLAALSWKLGQSGKSGSNALPVSAQTLAILPFVNNNPESTGDYLVLGFTDAVGSRLSAASGLELAGLFSASALQRQGLTPRAVGERLRTMYVLEGSVRTVSERLHTSVRLTRVADGSLLWSREFSAPSSDVVALEQEVADSIGKALQVQPADSDAAAAPTAIRAEAYDLYLKGRYAWEQRTRSKMEEALAYYRGAVARDPQFALAYSSLAEAYVNMLNFGHVPTREALAIAEVASAKAIALDTSLAEGYSTRGQVLASRGDYAAAESAFRHAIEVRPGAPWAHHYYALLLAMEGRFAEAERETRRTLAIDPLSVPANATLGILMAQQGRLDNARTQLERTLQLSPNFVVTLYYLGSVEAAGGRYEQARAHLEQALATAPNFPGVRGALAYTFSKSGRDSDARRLLRESRERVAGQASMSDERTRLNHALDMALIGNADSAFAMMRTAQWDIPTLFDLRADPLLRRVRADPRYSKLAGALRIKS